MSDFGIAIEPGSKSSKICNEQQKYTGDLDPVRKEMTCHIESTKDTSGEEFKSYPERDWLSSPSKKYRKVKEDVRADFAG